MAGWDFNEKKGDLYVHEAQNSVTRYWWCWFAYGQCLFGVHR